MKIFNTLVFTLFFVQLGIAQLNLVEVSNLTYNQDLNDIWGYVAPDGTEYALVGARNGVSIVSLADPANPIEVDFIPGQNSTWRDLKTWGSHAYVTSDEPGTTDGLLVIDLSNLPNEVSSFNWNPTLPDGTTINTCHNLYIDDNGICYLSGCGASNAGGLIFIDVVTNPGMPSFIGYGNDIYSHDVYVRDNIAYSSEILAGQLSIYDVSDLNNPILEASQNTPFDFCHNAWLSDDAMSVFTTDEIPGAPIASYDISDLNDIKLLDEFIPLAGQVEDISAHNVHVLNDYIVISYYQAGCVVVDAARPGNLIEVGNFDTFLDPVVTDFDGAWGAYPFLPSGLILVTDITYGLFVLEPNYVRGCYLEGNVTDASNNNPIFNASIQFIDEPLNAQSDLAGAYQMGLVTPGSYQVEVSRVGYETQIATAVLENGELTILNFELIPIAPIEITGTVIEEGTGQPIENALISATLQDLVLETTTDSNGDFSMEGFAGNWEIVAGKWGFSTVIENDIQLTNDNPDAGEFILSVGYEDIFTLDLGWEVKMEAGQGDFYREVPVGIEFQGFGYLTQSDGDLPQDIGDHCYFTGNSDDLVESVLNMGTTSITSPIMDLSQMNQPIIDYYTWIFSLDIGTQSLDVGDDKILVKITNGIETVTVDEKSFSNVFTGPTWEFGEINVDEHIEVTNTMQVIFDIDQGTIINDVSEMAIDYFRAFDANPTNTSEINTDPKLIELYPNPTADFLTIRNYSGKAIEQVQIKGIDGKLITRLNTVDAQIDVSQMPGGLYVLEVETNGQWFTEKFIVF